MREDDALYDPSFAHALQQAKEAFADRVEESLQAQALRGRTAWDTTAAIFLLKGYRPQFRDQYQVNVRQESVSISMDLSDLPPADKALLLRRLADRAEGTHLLPEGREP